MHWRTRRRGDAAHPELSPTEARQGDSHDENRPPLVVGVGLLTLGFIVVFVVIWLFRQSGMLG